MVIEVSNEAPHRMDPFAAGHCAVILNFLAGIDRESFRAGSVLSGKDDYSGSRQHPGRNWRDAAWGVAAVPEEAYSRTAHHSDRIYGRRRRAKSRQSRLQQIRRFDHRQHARWNIGKRDSGRIRRPLRPRQVYLSRLHGKRKPLQLSDPSRSRLGLFGETSVHHRRQNRLPRRGASYLYHGAFLCLLSWIKKPKVHFQLLSSRTGRGLIEGRDRCAVGGFSFYLEKTPGVGREGNGEPARRNRDPEGKKDPSVYPSPG